MRTETEVLAVERLTIRYGRRVAVEDVSLSAPAGSVYVLLGRNGAGKSSLVRCVLGQQKPAAGRALLFGHDAWRRRAGAMRRVGVVPETPDAPPEMTAPRLLAFCARLYPRWEAAEAETRLKRFEVPRDVPFERLSKGQKGAVMLTLALGHAPDLLVLDDPTLGLDVIARRGFYDELLGDLADRGTTVFITTHDLAGVEGVANRVGMLSGGHLVVDEPVEALKARFRRLRIARAPIGAAEPAQGWGPFRVAATKTQSWGTEAVVSDFDEETFGAWQRDSGAEVEAESASLEDIFATVVGNGKGDGR
jgi:ABC-2 type transport system ATP-binding protein